MYIKKNICENIMGTIMNIARKTKDTLSSLYDLVEIDIRLELHPVTRGDKVYMPAAQYCLFSEEQAAICRMLMGLKTLDGFVFKLSRCVNEKKQKIFGMKSYDCHMFIQRLLPFIMKKFLSKEVCEPLIILSFFFKDLCSKTLSLDDLDHLQNEIVLTFCKLVIIFLLSFFDEI